MSTQNTLTSQYKFPTEVTVSRPLVLSGPLFEHLTDYTRLGLLNTNNFPGGKITPRTATRDPKKLEIRLILLWERHSDGL